MGSTSIPEATPIQVQDVPIGARRPVRIVCIGSGYSGLMMAIIVKEKMRDQNVSFQIYEKNNDLGGTWLVNRYPGCQCDIPAHNYAYSFEPNPAWKNYYATSAEIHQYMKHVSAKYGCDEYMAYGHTVTGATWQEQAGKWIITVKNQIEEFTDTCDVLINAGGVLSNWGWPTIPGIENFQGKLLHSAAWDPSFDWTNKNIAVIGIGSSGIQIIPKVAQGAKHVDFFVRSSTWITPGPGALEPTAADPEMDVEYNYAEQELRRFAEDPEYLRAHRSAMADKRIANFKRTVGNPEEQARMDSFFRAEMLRRLGSRGPSNSKKADDIARWLLPDFPAGCRRLTPGPGFLEAIVEDHVDSWWDNIDHVTETGIRCKDGSHKNLDAIICATGFDTTFKPSFRLVGRDGVDLAKKWAVNDPEAYFGTTVPDFPNYFAFIGPNSPVSNGSLVQAVQMQGIYIYRCITKLQTQGLKSMAVSAEATREYNDYSQAWLSRTVWTAPCRSWYKRGTTDGKVVALYAGSCYHWAEALREPRWEDYHLEHFQGPGRNRFSYLGNGFTAREVKGGSVSDTQTLDFEEYWKLMILPEIHT